MEKEAKIKLVPTFWETSLSGVRRGIFDNYEERGVIGESTIPLWDDIEVVSFSDWRRFISGLYPMEVNRDTYTETRSGFDIYDSMLDSILQYGNVEIEGKASSHICWVDSDKIILMGQQFKIPKELLMLKKEDPVVMIQRLEAGINSIDKGKKIREDLFQKFLEKTKGVLERSDDKQLKLRLKKIQESFKNRRFEKGSEEDKKEIKSKKGLTILLSEQDRKEIEDDENVTIFREARKALIEKKLMGTEKLDAKEKRKAELSILRKTNVQTLRDSEAKERAKKMASILKKKQSTK